MSRRALLAGAVVRLLVGRGRALLAQRPIGRENPVLHVVADLLLVRYAMLVLLLRFLLQVAQRFAGWTTCCEAQHQQEG